MDRCRRLGEHWRKVGTVSAEQVRPYCTDKIALIESILNPMNRGMLLLDDRLCVLAVNPRFSCLFPDTGNLPLFEKPLGSLLGAMDRAGAGKDAWAEALQSAANGGSAFTHRHDFGAGMICDLQGIPLSGVGYLLTFDDVREQARGEKAVLHQDGRIQEILDHSPIGVNIIGPDGLRRYSNRKMSEILGYAESELRQTNVREHYVDPSDRDRLFKNMSVTGAIENEEIELLRKDGQHFWGLLSCRPFPFDGEDCILGWVYEITDRLELERSQIRSREELEMQVLELRDREDRMTKQAAELESLAFRLAESEKKMAEFANHDTLTGLPTLRLCHDRLQQAIAQSQRGQTLMAVFYVDLDGFKLVNDTYGHDAGDRVLKEAALRMRKCFREVDTVSRIGGDEFLIVLTGLGFRDAVVPLAQRLLSRFSDEFMLDDGGAMIGASIGIAFFNGASDTSESLIKRADRAMYDAKKNGKNQYSIA